MLQEKKKVKTEKFVLCCVAKLAVEGVNMVASCVKALAESADLSLSVKQPIHISNVVLVDAESN